MEDLHWTASGLRWEWLGTPEPPQKIVFFFSLWKPCFSAPKWCINIYLLSLCIYWHLKFTQGPTHIFVANFRGCWMADFTSGLQCRWAETAVTRTKPHSQARASHLQSSLVYKTKVFVQTGSCHPPNYWFPKLPFTCLIPIVPPRSVSPFMVL